MKKLLSVLLIATMIISLMPMGIMADENSLFTVYVTVCRHGEFVRNHDGHDMTIMPVEMDENDSYNLDDVFKELHRTYYAEDEYESADGEFGAYITKFWGDESGNYGYQINGGEVFVSGLSHEVCDGDYIDVAIYKNYYPDTEAYTKFEKYEEEVTLGESIELSLFQAGYDENWLRSKLSAAGLKGPEQLLFAFVSEDTLHMQAKERWGGKVVFVDTGAKK